MQEKSRGGKESRNIYPSIPAYAPGNINWLAARFLPHIAYSGVAWTKLKVGPGYMASDCTTARNASYATHGIAMRKPSDRPSFCQTRTLCRNERKFWPGFYTVIEYRFIVSCIICVFMSRVHCGIWFTCETSSSATEGFG